MPTVSDTVFETQGDDYLLPATTGAGYHRDPVVETLHSV
jgi:hypothetical protein